MDQEMTMYLKTYKTEKNFMVAVCDKELIGRKLMHGDVVIEITEGYYKGEPADESEIIDALMQATTANIFGQKSVNCAVKAGIVDEDSILMIEDVPHALYFTL